MQLSGVSGASSRYDYSTNRAEGPQGARAQSFSGALASTQTIQTNGVSSVDNNRNLGTRPNFSSMTPQEFNQAAQKMYDSGEIDLGTRATMWLNGRMAANMNGNTKMDFISYFKVQLEVAASHGGAADPRSGYSDLQKILDLMTK